MRKSMLIVSLIISTIHSSYAQHASLSAGGDASSFDGSVSYSVGQVFYLTDMGPGGSVANGVQQPYEISNVTGVDGPDNQSICLSSGPNPVSDMLTLNVEDRDLNNLRYGLFDAQGKFLSGSAIITNHTSILMKELAPAIYFIRVFRAQNQISIFKIAKN